VVLVAVGLAGWALVVPYFQARRALERNVASDPETIKMEVIRFGGPSAAARKLRVYLMVPDRNASGIDRRMVAVQMLEHCGEHGTGSLVKLLDVVDSEPPLGAYAAHVLAEIGPPAAEAVPALREKLGSRNLHLRCEAAAALWRITGESREVIPVMVDTMRHGITIGLGTPQRAGSILAEIGPEAVPALEKLLKDEDPQVRQAAAEAHDKIMTAREKKP
jgi:hypothetical protein